VADVRKHEHAGAAAFDQMSDDELRLFVAGETKVLALHVVEPLRLTSKNQ
jgi:hypothetical protein